MAEELQIKRGTRSAKRGAAQRTLESWADRSSALRVPQSALPTLHLSHFDYELPKHLIAQEPLAERDHARLMVVNRASGAISHHQVRDVPQLLTPGDLLVVNDSRVLPARLRGARERTGGKWEGLYLRQTGEGHWELLSQTRGRLEEGEWVRVTPPDSPLAGAEVRPPFRLHLITKTNEGDWLAEPNLPGSPEELLQQYGHVPLPPYIRKGEDQPADRERYQTIYAQHPGSVAAPTAGLHFTPNLLNALKAKGVERTSVTLHVGLGTFQPIPVEQIAAHRMHREWADLPEAAARAIADRRARNRRVAAVGTTSVRVLESVAATGPLRPWSGETDLFIHPPYEFKLVDALLTNFHLPRSSLLVLVSAFAGMDLIRRAYELAIHEKYRFYSYGDAMLIV